jgi:hypothetical protein
MKQAKHRTWKFQLATFVAIFPVMLTSAFADTYSWTNMTSIPAGQYWSASLSNDGTTIVGSSRSNYIYRSSDAGSTWVQAAGTASGSYYFAISNDGSKIFAAGNEGGYNYTSIDSGVTWVARTPGAVSAGRPCMSDDGQNIMIGPWGGIPRVSNDGGATWANVTGLSSGYWVGCAISFDGSVRYVLQSSSSSFKRSTDGGATWASTTLPHTSWNDIGISRDGSIVYLAGSSRIYKSIDYGQSFTWMNSGTTMTSAYYIAVSGDGSKIAVFDNTYTIKLSSDSGSTWQAESTLGNKNWYAGDISDDGTKIVAPVANNGNYIYKNGFVAATRLSLTSGSATTLRFRAQNTIRATANFAGKVTFYANGKRIGGCISVATVSLVATCNYKPTNTGSAVIMAKLVPTNVSYSALTTELFRTKISPRGTIR